MPYLAVLFFQFLLRTVGCATPKNNSAENLILLKFGLGVLVNDVNDNQVDAPNLSNSMVEVFAMTQTLIGVLYNRNETEMDGFRPPHKL